MRSLVPRLLLAGASLICGFGAIAHAMAYGRQAAAALTRAQVPPFFAAELRVLWLADSTTLAGLALIFGYVAVRPAAASAATTMLLALLPGATALLLYVFLGPFYAGHLLLVAAAMAFAAGVLRVAPAR
jgi:hypothetical protein